MMKSVSNLVSKKVAITLKVAVFYTQTNPAEKFFNQALKVMNTFEAFCF
ncbi:MAG: hypothetical protein IJE43_20185 [Alphaproteobacteria bacterium]|nr:hypothetical protein [Alphaproteobacteria bacterium]